MEKVKENKFDRLTARVAARGQRSVNPVDGRVYANIPIASSNVPAPVPDVAPVVEHTGKRGRPKGSSSRKEEYNRVGFEAPVSLLEKFDQVARKKGMMRREAFEAALQCFIVNK